MRSFDHTPRFPLHDPSPSEQEVPHLAPRITDIGCSYGNHNFAERSRVWFQACVGGAEPLTCGKTIVATTS